MIVSERQVSRTGKEIVSSWNATLLGPPRCEEEKADEVE
jgi:hypothetical protein